MAGDDREVREQLLRGAVLAGDARAGRLWYDECHADLHRYLTWRCGGCRDRADEAFQETWLTALRRVRRFDPKQGPFRAWLFGVGANIVRNQTRRSSARRVGTLSADHEAPGRPERADQSERIALALSSLSGRHESVLRAKYLDGLSVAAIATQWGESEKAVESLLTRARTAFREAFERGE